nr:hypothetical protein [Tanacetum cinerariifolium]
MAIVIGSLDQWNPLHHHANDSSCASIVYIKLIKVENYRVWASAMKLAPQIKHKIGHVFSNHVASVWNELKETYDRIDESIIFNLLQKINSFKQGGLHVSEYYHNLNSLWREFDILTKLSDCTCAASLLNREILPKVKDAFVIVSRKESHRGIPSSSVKIEKPQDLKRQTVLGTSSEFAGLYLFDNQFNKSTVSNNMIKGSDKFSHRPNEDVEGFRDGKVHQPDIGAFTDHAVHDEEHSATPIGIEFSKRKSDFVITALSYSDWAKCPVTRRSMASTTCEIIWIVKLLGVSVRNKRLLSAVEVNAASIEVTAADHSFYCWKRYKKLKRRTLYKEEMDLETAQTTTTAKLPILNQGEYDMWRLRIEQYFQVQDYALWDVIENGNSFIPVAQTTTNDNGTLTTLIPGPITTKEKVQKKNDVKARSMLLMALPNKHLMTFNQYKDAKTLFATIQTRFGGNEATKKTQKTLLKKMYEKFSSSSTYTNEVNTAEGVSTANTQVNPTSTQVNTVSTQVSTANLSDATVYAFLDSQPNGNWNQDSSRRTVIVEDTSSNAMVAIDGVSFD